MPTAQEIQNWLAANPKADDRTIAAAMNQYGVTPAQMAQATGLNVADVQNRYNAAMAPLAQPTPQPSAPATQAGSPSVPPYAMQQNRMRPAKTEEDWNRYQALASFAPGTDMTKAKADFMAGGGGQSGYYNQFPQTVSGAATPTPTGGGIAALGAGAGTGASATTTSNMGGAPASGLPAYQQQNQQQGIAQYAQPYVGSMLGATMGQLFNRDQSGNITGMRGYTPYSYNPADYFAAFTPMQQQVFQQAGQMQTPGQFGQATQAANAGILGALSAGGRYGQMATDPYATAMFMSPYMQNVVDTQMQQAKRQADIAGQTQQAQATRAGAFGGARDLIQRQQANAELQRNLANIQATGTQSAYQDAMKNIQNMANLGLQGAQAGISGAGQLGQLGTAQLGAQQNILNLQNQLGGQQQKQQQDIINQAVQNYNTAQQYPYMQLGFMQNMLQGLPITTTAQQVYQQPPSTLSQLAGLATTGLGLNSLLKDSGGLMGGLSSIGSGISSLFGFKEGGAVDAKHPAGLAELAISKM